METSISREPPPDRSKSSPWIPTVIKCPKAARWWPLPTVLSTIRITLGGSNDNITLDLAGQSVNQDVRVNLGGGDNSFTLTDGTIRGHLVVDAADGIDTIDVQSDITVRKNTTLKLGAGDNVATISGSFAGQLTVETDLGNDTVTIADMPGSPNMQRCGSVTEPTSFPWKVMSRVICFITAEMVTTRSASWPLPAWPSTP